MKVSYKQLQTYFDEKLPEPEALAESLAFHFAEVEGIEKNGDDFILDIKVLPDRSYAKSYEGIARELTAISGIRNNIKSAKLDLGKTFDVEIKKINIALGIEVPKSEIIAILKRMSIEVKDKGETLTLTVPAYRNDLNDWRDIPEEIGRIYGYDKIPAKMPQAVRTNDRPKVEKTFYYGEKIKNILVEMGFSEVYTYSLASKGDFKIEKSVAQDKNFLRTNLTEQIMKSLELNHKNSELLGLSEIKVFEIGKVFPKTGEHTALCIGIKNVKKKDVTVNEKIRNTREQLLLQLGSKLNTLCTIDDSGGLLILGNKQIGVINNTDGILELNLDMLIEPLPMPSSYEDLHFQKSVNTIYKPFSIYPFVVRDIALWAPQESETEIRNLILKEAGNLMIKLDLFDTFEKTGRTSYAFRMIFQSPERTLEEHDTAPILERITSLMKQKGWEVR